MAKKNHDPNEEENQEIEFDRTMNLSGDEDQDAEPSQVDPQPDEAVEEEDDYAVGVGGQTIALGDDAEFIEQLLQAEPSEESAQARTIQLGSNPNLSGSSEHVNTEKLGSAAGSDDIGSRTIDSGSMGSSQLAAIWRRHFDSDANPMMSVELPGSKTSIGDEYKLNPRFVKSGAGKVETDQEIDYRLGRMVGEGGMGEVYSAKQQAVDRKVAFKRIRKTLIDETNNNPQKRKRIERKFLTEAHITASLDHPNIVTIHDLGVDQDGGVFYCMEFINGSEWHEVFDKQPIDDNLEILLRVADGIAYAHSKDIIHRDLKPENVMIGKFSQVSIMDWGLAVELKKGRPSNLAGTPAYLAPEMAKGPKSAINKLSDIYLLGALLFHICTGRPPHHGKTMSACIQSAARNTFRKTKPSHEALMPLLGIAYTAMETRQEDRYQTVSEFQDAIRAYQSTQQSITQSFALSEKSETELSEAQTEKDYEKFSSALFGFRESKRLFPANTDAGKGLALTKHAYATCALQRQDFELGLSLLDEDENDDRELIQQLKKQQKTVESRKNRVRLLAIASSILFAVFMVYFAYNNLEQRRLIKVANEANANLSGALKTAEDEKNRAISAETETKKALKAEATERIRAAKAEMKAKEDREIALKAEEDAKAAEAKTKIALGNSKIAEEEAREAEMTARAAETKALAAQEETREALKAEAKERERAVEAEKKVTTALVRAQTDRERAVSAEKEARKQEILAREQENLAKSRLFNSNINLADSLIRDNQIPQALSALKAAKSADNSVEFLGWEYNRLLHLCHTKDVAEERFAGAVGFAPISKNEMVVADRNGTISIWKNDTSEVKTLKTGVEVSSFDVSKDGQLVAVGSAVNNSKFTVWNLNTGQMVKDLSSVINGNHVTQVEFSADGKQLAVADSNSGVYGWQVSGGNIGQVTEFRRLHSKPVIDFAFSQDGSSLATISADGLCLVWSWQSQEPVTAFVHSAPLTAVAFRPSTGKPKELAVADSKGEIVFLDATVANDFSKWMKQDDSKDLEALKKQIKKSTIEAHQSAINAIQFSQRGSFLYSGGDDRVVRIWNLNDQTEIKSLRGHDEAVSGLRVLNGGKTIASIAQTGQLRIWDVNKYEDERVFDSRDKGAKEFVSFSQNGRWFAEGSDSGKLFVRDKDSPDLAIELAYDNNIGKNASWLPRSRQLITSGKNRLNIWKDGRSVFQTEEIGGDGHFAVSADESRLITGGDAGSRRTKAHPTTVWDTQTGQKIGDLLPSGSRYRVTSIAISPDNRYAAVATGSTEGIIFLFDLNTLQEVDKIEAHRGWISDLKFFPDNRLASADSLEGYVNVWTTTGGRMTLQKKVNDIVGSYIRISVSPNGNQFVTSSNEDYLTVLKVWDARNFDLVATKKSKSNIRYVQFRESGDVAFVQADGRYATWNINRTNVIKPKSFQYVSLKGRIVNGWDKVDEDTTITYGSGFTYLTSGTQSGVVNSYGNVSRCIDAQFVNNDTAVVALYADGLIRIWDLKTKKILGVLNSGSENSPVTGISVSPNHKMIAACNESGLQIIDATTRKVVKGRSVEHSITSLDWASESTIYLGTESGKVVQANLNKAEFKLIDACDSRIDSIRVSPDEKAIGVIAKSSRAPTGNVYVVRKEMPLSTGPKEGTGKGEGKPEGTRWVSVKQSGEKGATLDLFDGGKRVVTGNQSGTVTVWEIPAASDEPLRQLISMSQSDNPVSGISISPDNRLLLTSSSDGQSVLWLTEGWESEDE